MYDPLTTRRALFSWLVAALVFAFICLTPSVAHAAFGLTSTTDFYTIDTGSTPGLVFKIRRTNNGSNTQSPGDIASLVYNGIEYQDQSRGSQVNSGVDYIYSNTAVVSVDALLVGADFIKVTVVSGDPAVSGILTHYYMARRGDPFIYMATHFTSEPTGQALCRYILRMQVGNLTNGPTP